jgi:RNA polymerase sigma-70 factor (ECF subfamily)
MAPRSERFERIYHAHYAAVLAYALRRAPRPIADDVVAETFLVVWRRLADVPDDAAPWLYGVARRVLANERRASARRLALTERLRSAPRPAPADAGEGVLAAALEHLTEREREALTLVAWEGLTAAQASRAAGCSHAAMRVRLHRARRRLARALEASEALEEAIT